MAKVLREKERGNNLGEYTFTPKQKDYLGKALRDYRASMRKQRKKLTLQGIENIIKELPEPQSWWRRFLRK